MDDLATYYRPPAFDFAPPPPRERHSRLGIASFVLALLSGFAIVAAFSAIFVMAIDAPQRRPDTLFALAIGTTILASMAVSFVGLALGIASVVQSTRKRVFGILGLVFNTILFFAMCGIMAIGFVVSRS
ncbi:MAG: hypothetical protein JW809_07855 [Pirellulales bacterium]|nr:hypothetical protein [Pirellulales bacterium]